MKTLLWWITPRRVGTTFRDADLKWDPKPLMRSPLHDFFWRRLMPWLQRWQVFALQVRISQKVGRWVTRGR